MFFQGVRIYCLVIFLQVLRGIMKRYFFLLFPLLLLFSCGKENTSPNQNPDTHGLDASEEIIKNYLPIGKTYSDEELAQMNLELFNQNLSADGLTFSNIKKHLFTPEHCHQEKYFEACFVLLNTILALELQRLYLPMFPEGGSFEDSGEAIDLFPTKEKDFYEIVFSPVPLQKSNFRRDLLAHAQKISAEQVDFSLVQEYLTQNLKKIPKNMHIIESINAYLIALYGDFSGLDYHGKKYQAKPSKKLFGMGLETFSGRGVFISRVLDGADSPLLPGDKVLSIEETLVTTHTQVIELLSTKKSASLKILREGKELEVSLVKKALAQEHLSYQKETLSFGTLHYLGFSGFAENTAKSLRQKIEGFAPQDILILDLRDNNGGLLSGAEQIADFFLEKDVPLFTEVRLGGEKTKVITAHESLFNGTVIFLQSPLCISACEILARSLYHRKKPTYFVGETTYGKFSFQSAQNTVAALPFHQGKFFKVRINRGLIAFLEDKELSTPNLKGLTPDFSVSDQRFQGVSNAQHAVNPLRIAGVEEKKPGPRALSSQLTQCMQEKSPSLEAHPYYHFAKNLISCLANSQ